jgi:hypothetical protein
VQSQ